MLFNSYEYILFFLPLTFFIYFYLNQKRLTTAANSFLVFASLFFYSWWNIAYLPLILISMLFNYSIGNALSRKQEHTKLTKRTLLSIGIAGNLSLLAYYKYADFFITNINMVFHQDIELLHLILPLAISFFTFQQIAYLVDSYKMQTKEYNFLNYAVFVSFFPQLIAGPIVHHKEMMPQFANKRTKIINYKNIALGLMIFSIGLFKKVVIADTFANIATPGFDSAEILTFLEAWAVSLSYTFQLYYDFSGYTDMAIGAALLFNIKLPINFNAPYQALDIQDFWRRWHITLSRFLRDYIYIPLGGNRKGEVRTYTNLMITFLLGGLWHGAGWTFIFWGFLHGFALGIHRFWKSLGFKMHKILAWIITFNFINISWVFFRAQEFSDAVKIIKGMFGFSSFSLSSLFYISEMEFVVPLNLIIPEDKRINLFIILLFIGFIFLEKKVDLVKLNKNHKTLFYFIMFVIFIIPLLNLRKISEFLYFQF